MPQQRYASGRWLCLVALLLVCRAQHAQGATPAPVNLPPDDDQTWLRTTPKGAPRLIALTFDDGPAPGTGDAILNTLKAVKWLATFCVIETNVQQHPEMVKRMLAEGHEVASHSWSHKNLTQLDADEVGHEVGDSLNDLRTLFKIDVHWFRPPFSAVTPAIRDRIRAEFGCALLGLTTDSEDWKRPPDGTITKNLLADLPDGSVILCHEWSEQTAKELPFIISELVKRGYRSVTISQLLATRRKH